MKINSMYIRKVKTRNKETGTEYFTYRLVTSIRTKGVPKQINLLSLGKLEGVSNDELTLLAKHINQLYNHINNLFPIDIPDHIKDLAHFYTQKLIQKNFIEKKDTESDYQEYSSEKQFVEIDINSITGKTSEQIGGEFLCKQAINELGLDTFLKEKLKFTDSQLDNCMLALLGRLLYSSSENQTARWLSDNSAIQEFYPMESGKVNKNQLYSACNLLYLHKQQIEQYLNRSIENIFDFKRKIVLYDLTNMHFEGQMKKSTKTAYGKNKQKRNDCPQITLGMLTDENGFPFHTQYYKGNIAEPNTLEGILKGLSTFGANLFDNQKPCVIIDAGIATDANVKMLLKQGYQYICVSRSSNIDLINNVNENELVKFKNKSEKELSAQLFKQDFEYDDFNNEKCCIKESLIYIKSPDKEKKERAMDEKKINRFEEGLQGIEKTILNPRGQRSIAKIHQRLGRLKEKNRGITQLFDIEIEDDTNNVISISWKRKIETSKEKKQGVYFLRTNIEEKEESKLWHLYRLINEVEEAFGTLKSELKVRPNFHQKDSTIEAHINLCVLSYYIVSFIRYRLKQKGITHSWSEIRRLMSTQKRCLQVSRTKNEEALWTKFCTRPIPQVEQIYQGMGYKKMPYYRKNIVV